MILVSKSKSRNEKSRARSAIMRAVKSYDTAPEKTVRKIAYAIKPGFRLYRDDLVGKPDIAYISSKRAIFVHGCFWHGHSCARGDRKPKTNIAYWSAKIARNRERDSRVRKKLARLGWRTLVIWECTLNDKDRVQKKLLTFLGKKRPTRIS